MTSKNGKTLKEIKKSQKKTNYKTNTVTSLPLNPQGLIPQSNQTIINNQNIISISNKNNNTGNNKEINSYKASTHKQSKGKKIITLNSSNNRSPDPKNRIPMQRNNIQTEVNNKKGEMYLKINKTKSFANQRLNNSNIIGNQSLGNNSLRILKSGVPINNPQNLSNDRIIRGDMKGNNVIITKDGKRFVLAKNVHRVRKEDDEIRKLEEKRKNKFRGRNEI